MAGASEADGETYGHGHLSSNRSEDSRRSLVEAAASDVALLLSESPDGVWALSETVQKQTEARIRVAIGLGRPTIDAKKINDASAPAAMYLSRRRRAPRRASARLSRLLGTRQAAPCVVAAVRRLQLASADASGRPHGLPRKASSGLPGPGSAGRCSARTSARLFQPPHTRTSWTCAQLTAKGWYFARRKGLPDERYEADADWRAPPMPKDLFHLYLSGAGGTGKSCFLDHVYRQYVNRPDVLRVWYRVDVPSSEWTDVQQRILKDVARRRSGEAGCAERTAGADALRRI